MKVKRYVVDSMPVAMQQIRGELGEKAIILNTKEIKTGGFLGIFAKRQFEVIAAVPVHPEAEKRAAKPAPLPIMETKKPAAPVAIKREEVPLERNEDILRELRGVKQMLAGLVAGEKGTERLPAPFMPWVERLREQEVDSQVIQFIIEKLLRGGHETSTSEKIQEAFVAEITRILSEGCLQEPAVAESINFVSFVGPTGVGKTTTIAKLAADQILNYGRFIGLVTTDTYRIAAVEQLKTYANILNVPIEIAFTPEGLRKSVKNLRDRDLIFMDTTGRNYQDQLAIQEIAKYLAEPMIQENYLVLSMTAKYSDTQKIIENFKSIPIDKVILTKRDETSTFGLVLNLAYHYPYPLAYITTGQSVPEDIQKIMPEAMAKLILGVTDHDQGSGPTT